MKGKSRRRDFVKAFHVRIEAMFILRVFFLHFFMCMMLPQYLNLAAQRGHLLATHKVVLFHKPGHFCLTLVTCAIFTVGADAWRRIGDDEELQTGCDLPEICS
jgi:hypothetical protein